MTFWSSKSLYILWNITHLHLQLNLGRIMSYLHTDWLKDRWGYIQSDEKIESFRLSMFSKKHERVFTDSFSSYDWSRCIVWALRLNVSVACSEFDAGSYDRNQHANKSHKQILPLPVWIIETWLIYYFNLRRCKVLYQDDRQLLLAVNQRVLQLKHSYMRRQDGQRLYCSLTWAGRQQRTMRVIPSQPFQYFWTK